MDSVCCILDVDGFCIRTSDNGVTFTSKFLVRELGYVRVQPDYEFLPMSYRFDLRAQVDIRQCSGGVRQTLRYQTRNVTGLSIYPDPGENCVSYECLDEVVRGVYERCRRTAAPRVAYKGGNREKDILDRLGIPSLDLQTFGCPSFVTLVGGGQVTSSMKDCGQHTHGKPGLLVHCPLAEVVAFRDWFMRKLSQYSSRGPCGPIGNCSSASSSAPSWQEDSSSSD